MIVHFEDFLADSLTNCLREAYNQPKNLINQLSLFSFLNKIVIIKISIPRSIHI